MERRRWWLWLGVIAAVGFGLRLAGALGGLWLDEAASAIQARDAGTAMGVFLQINHDNNHHLNSLWMQAVGFGAAPPLARALSIATGTAMILVAGVLGARRAPLLGLITAIAFALSPILVTLGSEARGYAPMAFAMLVAILLTDRWLAGDAERSPATALALCFFLGAFSQLIMVFGFCALAGWVFLALWQRKGLRGALAGSAKLLAPSVVALLLVAAIIWGAAMGTPRGFTFGAWSPFTWTQYLQGLSDMAGYTLGVPALGIAWLAIVPALVIVARCMGASRFWFSALAILAFPAAIALLHPGNVVFARYYLLVSLALLLLVPEIAWIGLIAGGWKRWAAASGLAAFAVGSLACDIDLIRNQRGDPGAAIRALQARAPAGARVFIEREQGLPILVYAAAAARFPLAIAKADCPAPRFLFIDRFEGQDFPATPVRCGSRYVPIAQARARGLSGSHWTLYEVRP
ncbi:hypothetical protein [Sphingomonas hengshuiensis]|nr:hypothetical protein [Sphingomonas hengshuiensis]